MENKAVQLVTIKELVTLFKDGQPANAIELAHVNEHNFDIVVGKGLYNVGDKALYIQPDYCVPLLNEDENNQTLVQKLFLEYTQPNGDKTKSKLGKGGRIRAIKFNFTTSVDIVEPTYSFGILLPLNVIYSELGITSLPENLDEFFEITKYEEPETGHSGLNKGDLPLGMYSTDETNIMNLTNISYPINLTGSLKIDGSSETIYYKSDEENGICSRNLEKSLVQRYVANYTNENNDVIRKHVLFNKETNEKINGWFNETTQVFYSEPQQDWSEVYKEVKDSFVELGLPILKKLTNYCKENNLQLALRGELHGQGLKGSGNKNNPHSNVKQNIKFYCVDDYSKGVTKKLPLTDFYNILNDLGLESCDVFFKNETFNSFDEIKNRCNEIFKTNLIEGIVLKNETNTFSAKFMNPMYDAKK